MYFYRKFRRIYVCDRLIRLQTHSLYEKHNTQTSAVQQSYITHWYVALMFTVGPPPSKNYTCMQHFSCLFSLGLVSLNFWNGKQGNSNSDISVIKLVFTHFWILSIVQYSEHNTSFWKLISFKKALLQYNTFTEYKDAMCMAICLKLKLNTFKMCWNDQLVVQTCCYEDRITEVKHVDCLLCWWNYI